MIRQLNADDLTVFRQVRLAALADAPSAFGSTWEQERTRSDAQWLSLLTSTSRATFIWSDPEPRGLVGALNDDDPSVMHLVSLWVHPEARSAAASGALVRHVIAWATDHGATTLRLVVTSGNERAERLYLRHGFSRTGFTHIRDRDGAVMVHMARELLPPH